MLYQVLQLGWAAPPPNPPADFLQGTFRQAFVIMFPFFIMICHQFSFHLSVIFMILHNFVVFVFFPTMFYIVFLLLIAFRDFHEFHEVS